MAFDAMLEQPAVLPLSYSPAAAAVEAASLSIHKGRRGPGIERPRQALSRVSKRLEQSRTADCGPAELQISASFIRCQPLAQLAQPPDGTCTDHRLGPVHHGPAPPLLGLRLLLPFTIPPASQPASQPTRRLTSSALRSPGLPFLGEAISIPNSLCHLTTGAPLVLVIARRTLKESHESSRIASHRIASQAAPLFLSGVGPDSWLARNRPPPLVCRPAPDLLPLRHDSTPQGSSTDDGSPSRPKRMLCLPVEAPAGLAGRTLTQERRRLSIAIPLSLGGFH
ncbi:hypothetical protein AK830_g2705 [Neonectria ditissima]|uniref:Uncharacterized protein n=1 Tax=Neonectria ditissima TaxID=78410 RepID=A0A0P7BJJ7_9HYPO|nr:hypothetical protein AK830_g2705 [Neonectria ditissima]